MTFEIALVLIILGIALILFVSEWLRMDLVALLVLVSLTITGLVNSSDIFTGFSNPAVITIWAMFILSEALSRSGIATIISHQLFRMTGANEIRMIIVVMLTSGCLSAVMNNIGVAALMLPVVMDLCRRTGLLPSRLLMPLAYGTLLGGLTTLFGTPPNLLVSIALKQNGLTAFQIFDFTPIGLSALVAGILFVAFIGRHLLPKTDVTRLKGYRSQKDLIELYGLKERISILRVPEQSSLTNKQLLKTQLTYVLGLTIIGLFRQGKTILLPPPSFQIHAGDRLLVAGRTDRFNELKNWHELSIERQTPILQQVASDQLVLAEVRLNSESHLVDKRFDHSQFRTDFGVVLLGIRRGLTIIDSHFSQVELQAGDWLLVQGNKEQVESLKKSSVFTEVKPIDRNGVEDLYDIFHQIFVVRVPRNTTIIGQSMTESRLGDAFDFRIIGMVREGDILLMPDPATKLQEKDLLLIQGRREDIGVLRGLQELELELETENVPDLTLLESEKMTLLEVMLSPRSSLLEKSVAEINFEEKYGLRMLAIWRKDRSIRSDLEKQILDTGDAFLLLGPRDKLNLLTQDDDFLILSKVIQVKPDKTKTIIATLVMLAVIIQVLINWLPISVSAVMGVCLMVSFGALSMEDAYRAIDWRSVFLIAGMIPLGIAMESSGAASYLASSLLTQLSGFGPWPVIISLYLITMLATLVMPNAALVVVMSPMVFYLSDEMNVSVYALMMVVAIAASASFASPISHPVNTLVMGPGGYRFVNYLKMGLPLTFIVMVVSLLLLPVFWPFYG